MIIEHTRRGYWPKPTPTPAERLAEWAYKYYLAGNQLVRGKK